MILRTPVLSFVCTLLLTVSHAAVIQSSPSSHAAVIQSSPSKSRRLLENITCDYVVAGGGWAGVYFAYRVATTTPGEQICLFEGSSRIGGRTYSVPVEGTEFTLDVGAYRFSPDMHLPGDLILDHFDLPTECYEPGCPPAYEDFGPPFMFNYTAPLQRIVNPETGLPQGYFTAINAMLEEMEALGNVMLLTETPVSDILIESENGAATLIFDDTLSVTASKVTMLNLPRNQLFALPSVENGLTERTAAMLKCVVFDMPSSLFTEPISSQYPSALSKAYVLYPEAWWLTQLNETEGEWPEGQSFNPVETESGIFLNIHWNDGPTAPIVNEAGQNVTHGFLEVYYDATNETFFASVAQDRPSEPLGQLWGGSENPAQNQAKLNELHAALLDALSDVIASAGVDPATLPEPEALVVGVWSRPWDGEPLGGNGYTAPTKVYYAPDMSGTLAQACEIPGLTDDEYRDTALHPFQPTLDNLSAAHAGSGVGSRTASSDSSPSYRVFLANNDYVAMNVYYMFGDWAEESLLMAERALSLMGLPKPEWLNQSYYDEKVLAFAA